MTTVETPRLRLRPMQQSDAEPFLEIHQDPEVIKHVLLGAPPGGRPRLATFIGQGG